jgi:hypothetical protein
MIDVYVEVEYLVTNCADFDAEFEQVTDAVFELDQASKNVFDTSPGANIERQTVIFPCLAKGTTIEEAVASAEQLIKQGIKAAASATWTWVGTKAFDYEAELDYSKAIYSSAVTV